MWIDNAVLGSWTKRIRRIGVVPLEGSEGIPIEDNGILFVARDLMQDYYIGYIVVLYIRLD